MYSGEELGKIILLIYSNNSIMDDIKPIIIKYLSYCHKCNNICDHLDPVLENGNKLYNKKN